MELICRKCESSNIIEKHNIPYHNVGVWCVDCGAWITWGSIKNSQLIAEGKHVAKVVSAEEIKELFVLIILENEDGLRVKHKLWKGKDTKKYNPIFLNAMLNGFNKSARDFSSLVDLLTYIKDKKVVISIEHEDFKGKKEPKIVKWSKAENLEW